LLLRTSGGRSMMTLPLPWSGSWQITVSRIDSRIGLALYTGLQVLRRYPTPRQIRLAPNGRKRAFATVINRRRVALLEWLP
jgi:hypothetical protein